MRVADRHSSGRGKVICAIVEFEKDELAEVLLTAALARAALAMHRLADVAGHEHTTTSITPSAANAARAWRFASW